MNVLKQCYLLLATLLLVCDSQAGTFVVSNNNDSGSGSLRQAINDANASGISSNIVWSGAGGTINLQSELPTIDVGLIIDASSASGLVTIQGANVYSNNNSLDIRHLVIGGTGFTKSGSGTLELSHTNTFVGGANLAAGTLAITNDDELGDPMGSLILNGKLQLQNPMTISRNMLLGTGSIDTGGADSTLTGVLSGTGGLRVSGGYYLTLSGQNTFTGGIVVNQSALTVSSEQNLGDISNGITLNSATLHLLSNTQLTRSISINNSCALLFDSNSTLSANLSGSGSIQVWDGNLRLVGNDKLNGNMELNGSKVEGNSNNLPSMIDMTNSELTFNQLTDGVYAGNLTGNGKLIKTGRGALAFEGVSTLFSLEIREGSLDVGNDAALGTAHGIITFNGGALRAISDFSSQKGLFITTGGGEIDTNGANLTFTGNLIQGDSVLKKTGAGTLTLLHDASLFRGGFDIEQGVLQGNSSSLNGNITNNSILAFSQITDGSFGGVIRGSGVLQKYGAGNLTLTGANSYSGGTIVNEGNLIGDAASIQGDILNNGGVTFTSVHWSSFDTETYSGNISGTGHVAVNDNLILSGKNSYSGGTTVGGNLQGDTDSLQGDIENNGTLNFSQEKDGNFSGNLSGLGNTYYTGNGQLFLTGLNSLTGSTNISGGHVVVGSGQALSPNSSISIYNGGSLDLGNFDVSAPSIMNGGSLNAQTRTLTTASYVQYGMLQTTLASESMYGRIIVHGSADLSGVLRIRLLGSYIPTSPSQIFRIIEATNINGRFSSIENPAALSFNILYGPNAVDISAELVPYGASAIDPNGSSLAAVLDDLRLNHPERMSPELGQLNTLDAAQLASALQQIAPSSLGSLANLSFQCTDSSREGLRRRFEAIRSADSSDHMAIYDSRLKDSVVAVVADAGADLNGIRDFSKMQRSSGPWGMFGSFDGAYGRLSPIEAATGTQPGYDFSSNGFTIGIDRRESEHLVLGLSSGFHSGKATIDFDEGQSNLKNLQVGLYGIYSLSNGVFTNTFIGQSKDWYETHRNIPLFSRRADASPTGRTTNATLETGIDRKWQSIIVSPSISVAYALSHINEFSEDGAGALNLHVSEQTAESLRTIVGARVSHEYSKNELFWKPTARLGWEHEYKDSSRAIDAQFSVGSNTFVTQTAQVGKDAAVAGVGLGMRSRSRINGQIDYQIELGRDNLSAHRINGVVHYNF